MYCIFVFVPFFCTQTLRILSSSVDGLGFWVIGLGVKLGPDLGLGLSVVGAVVCADDAADSETSME